MEILENVLSIDKIKHLQELGVNTGNASMTWMLYPYEEGKQPQLSLREWRTFKEPFRKEHCIPAFTLLDIFELLPKEIKTGTDTYWITMYFSDNCWHICYSMSDEFDYYQEFLSYSLIDAAYDIDDNGEVVPSLRQLDYNGGMSAIPLFVNLKKAIIELA